MPHSQLSVYWFDEIRLWSNVMHDTAALQPVKPIILEVYEAQSAVSSWAAGHEELHV